jgi:hypothetical protein
MMRNLIKIVKLLWGFTETIFSLSGTNLELAERPFLEKEQGGGSTIWRGGSLRKWRPISSRHAHVTWLYSLKKLSQAAGTWNMFSFAVDHRRMPSSGMWHCVDIV